jgi:HEAT repeat protein
VALLSRRPNIEKLARKGDVTRLTELLGREDLVRQSNGRLTDRDAELRVAAVSALSGIEGAVALDGVSRGLRDPVPAVRSAAIEGLRRRGYVEAAQPLINSVTNWTEPSHAALRGEALDTLASFGDPELPRRVAAELLSREAEPDDADAEVLRRLVESAGPGAPAATCDYLVLRLREGSVSSRARVLLAALAPECVDRLIDCLEDPSVQREAALALGSIHDARATNPLCHLLMQSEEPAVRAAVAWALGELRDPAAVAALLHASGDDDYDVRVQTIDAFDKLGHVAVAVSLSVYVKVALGDAAGQAALDGTSEDAPEEQLQVEAAQAPEPVEQREIEQSPAVREPREPDPLVRRARPLLRRLLGEPPA